MNLVVRALTHILIAQCLELEPINIGLSVKILKVLKTSTLSIYAFRKTELLIVYIYMGT